MQLPQINTTAKFFFTAPFNALDGIYTLTHMMRFESALEDGVNFVESLYVPAGQTQSQYDLDWVNYKKTTVLKLVQPKARPTDPDVIYYVPETLLAKVPDPQIIKAYDLYLAIDLGIFSDPNAITYMRDQLDDIAASVTGTLKTTNVFSNKTVYMTQVDYDAVETERAARIEGLDLFSKVNQELLAEISRLQTLVRNLEDALIAQQTP